MQGSHISSSLLCIAGGGQGVGVCVCVATEAWAGSMGHAMNKQWLDVSEANTGATPVSTVSNNTSSYSPYIETCMDYKHVVTIFFISHMNA